MNTVKSITATVFLSITIGLIYCLNTLTGPPLYKQIQNNLGMDYGLIRYDLKNNCDNDRQCFIKHIPKPNKSPYARVGDALIGLTSQNPQIDHRQVIDGILGDSTLSQKFLPQIPPALIPILPKL